MIAWRIGKARRRDTALTGEGSAKFPGRWNSAGRRMVYLGESRSLAALEVLAHAEDLSLLKAIEWIAIPVRFDDALISNPTRLPPDWDAIPPPASTRAIGDKWLDSLRSLALRVPSAVTKGEHNYLLNPQHPEFVKIKIGDAEPYFFDQRIAR